MSQSFTSDGIPIIDDAMIVRAVTPGALEHSGYMKRDFIADPVGGGPYAAPYSMPRLSRQERIERIKERERTQSNLSDLMKFHGVLPYHQGRTNSCWVQSTTWLYEMVRVKQGQSHQRFSPASVGALVTGFADVGGWCSKALRMLCDKGVCTADVWPGNEMTGRRYDTPESREQRKLYRPTEFVDFEPGDVEAVIDYILQTGTPVAIAAMWMRHAVVWSDPYIARDGSIGIKGPNSGYLRDANGWTAFEGRRMVFDEAVAIGVVTA